MSRSSVVALVAAVSLFFAAAVPAASSQAPHLVASAFGPDGTKASVPTGASGAESRRADRLRLKLDDGSPEVVVGLADPDDASKGVQAVVLNRFTPGADSLPLTLHTMMILFPKTCQSGDTGLRAGMTFEVVVYLDPSGGGDPADAELALRQSFEIRPSDAAFQKIRLATPLVVEGGDVWVGYTNAVTATDRDFLFHAALDTNSNRQRSWIFYNRVGANFAGDLLSSADFQKRIDTAGMPGNWLVRARGRVGQTERVEL